ncbi:MAG TPA: phage protease [Caulobacteraceae bacterium]|nr:phage protease [Caulobacteraceae bacterium]
MTIRSTTSASAVAAIGEAVAAASAEGEPLKHIRLLPMGKITSTRDGRSWNLRDLAHAQAVVDASKATAGATDIPIDYDHQLVFGQGEGKGGQAPASGWMKTLVAKPDGIWADVEWTDAAEAKLRAKEYRYFSPYFAFNGSTKDVTRILHGGLTNYPAITELAAVASATDPNGDTMDLTRLAAALGLAATATMDEIVAAATATHAAAAALKPVVKALGLKDGASVEELTAAASGRAEPDPKAFVPMASFKELQGQVRQLQETESTAAATAAVDAAIVAGKVTPAGRDHALKLYKADPSAFADFVGSAPAVIKPGGSQTAAAAGVDPDAPLSAEEKAAASAVGVSEEAFKKSRMQILKGSN